MKQLKTNSVPAIPMIATIGTPIPRVRMPVITVAALKLALFCAATSSIAFFSRSALAR